MAYKRKPDNSSRPIETADPALLNPTPLKPVQPSATPTNTADKPPSIRKVIVNPDGTITHDFGTLTQAEQEDRNAIEMGRGRASASYSKKLGNPQNPIINPPEPSTTPQQEELAAQVGKVQTPDAAQLAAEQAGINTQLNDISGAGEGALKGAIIGATSTGAIGAAGGALVGGVGAIPGAIGGALVGGISGAIAGFVNSRTSTLKGNALQATKIEFVSFKDSKLNIKSIIDATNKGILDPLDAVELYNNELAKIDRAERNLKYESTVKPGNWLDNEDELIKIESFNSITRQRANQEMQLALLNPNPNKSFVALSDIGDSLEQ